ncbi:hypothetical protein GOARA_082_00060 [Gordonia araii NBRC 100433]|uniref:DUF5642 domain-containing protein n=2 Tax=Gordonia araii TaxID=263909 RepID=G7H6Z4_9ACTN|nr:hypothetical protein GOARA_082_00060 [Gordonia araii NBRC 100433]
MLLAPSALPSGFSPVTTTVDELVRANAGPLDAVARMRFAPPDCRPTADAELNNRMSDENAAVLAARSLDASLTNIVVAGTRDIDADVRERTGNCATTRTTITEGTRTGAVITAEHRKLTPPKLTGERAGRLGLLGRLEVTQMFVFRTDTTTTMPDGATSRSVSFAGYAAAHTPGPDDGKNRFTVAVTVAGAATPFAKPFPEVSEPVTDKEFVELFGRALSAAGRL